MWVVVLCVCVYAYESVVVWPWGCVNKEEINGTWTVFLVVGISLFGEWNDQGRCILI